MENTNRQQKDCRRQVNETKEPQIITAGLQYLLIIELVLSHIPSTIPFIQYK